jgi:hypothetical protein
MLPGLVVQFVYLSTKFEGMNQMSKIKFVKYPLFHLEREGKVVSNFRSQRIELDTECETLSKLARQLGIEVKPHHESMWEIALRRHFVRYCAYCASRGASVLEMLSHKRDRTSDAFVDFIQTQWFEFLQELRANGEHEHFSNKNYDAQQDRFDSWLTARFPQDEPSENA